MLHNDKKHFISIFLIIDLILILYPQNIGSLINYWFFLYFIIHSFLLNQKWKSWNIFLKSYFKLNPLFLFSTTNIHKLSFIYKESEVVNLLLYTASTSNLLYSLLIKTSSMKNILLLRKYQ